MPKIEQYMHILDNKERTGIQNEITLELRRAEKKFPLFPAEADRGLMVLGEEYGESVKACLEFTFDEKLNSDDLREELIQTGAMVLRNIAMIDRMKAIKGR